MSSVRRALRKALQKERALVRVAALPCATCPAKRGRLGRKSQCRVCIEGKIQVPARRPE